MQVFTTNTLTRRALLRVVTGGLTAFALAGTALLTGCGGTSSDGNNGNNGGTGGTTTGNTGGGNGSGQLHLVASNVRGANASQFNYDNSTTAILNSGQLTITAFQINGSSSRNVQLILIGGAPKAGLTYSFSDQTSGPLAVLTYFESGVPGKAPGWTSDGKTGTAVIDSVDGKHIKLHVTNVSIIPGTDTGAVGSFTYDGTADVTTQ